MARWLAAFVLLLIASAVCAEPLRVGFGLDRPPYVFKGERRGLEYELIDTVARHAGFEIDPVFAPPERMRLLLQRGELDAIVASNPTDGAAPHYSETYIRYQNAVAALASRGYRIERIADLAAYSISTFQHARLMLGPEFQAMARDNPRYREEAQSVTRNRLLYSGRIEVILVDPSIFDYFNQEASEQVDVKQPLTWYRILPPTPYSVGFRDEDQRKRFDQGLKAIEASGEYKRIEQRYRRE